MEYSFRNSANGERVSLLLDDYGFSVSRGRQTELFAYANIISVRLTKSQGVYKAYVEADSRKPVVICSQTYSEKGKLEDQSKPYALFIRVLHHHLKDKSHATFLSGGDRDKLGKRVAVSAVLSFVISMIADYLGFSVINPYVQALALAGLMIVVIVMWTAGRMPRTYQPTEIPLQFLP